MVACAVLRIALIIRFLESVIKFRGYSNESAMKMKLNCDFVFCGRNNNGFLHLVGDVPTFSRKKSSAIISRLLRGGHGSNKLRRNSPYLDAVLDNRSLIIASGFRTGTVGQVRNVALAAGCCDQC